MNDRQEHPPYSMCIIWDPRDDIFVVDVPELPGCHTHGLTYEEAVCQGQDAIVSWLDAMRAWGRTSPAPRIYALDDVAEVVVAVGGADSFASTSPSLA
ncbi:MAG: type II toxin-antitoxin system HicB family antitoxin [Chloroflexota bacterium]|nr:type II toxin-antitoxin system HicB family antitoxin [Chloroflexota bacterium]